MSESVSLTFRALELKYQHGGYRAAARACGIDGAYFYRLAKGQATNPSKGILRKLGLRQVVAYEIIKRR